MHSLGAFVQITEAGGHRKIRTRQVMELVYVTFPERSCTQTCRRISKLRATYLMAHRDGRMIPHHHYGPKHLVRLREIGYTRSQLDPGVFYKGTPNGRSYRVVHASDLLDAPMANTLAEQFKDTEKGENLSQGDHERFGRAVGQLLWLAGDRPDLMYAVTLLASAVPQPTTKDWGMLKKVVRYLGSSGV
eukprot:1590839-Amphidinium_carterae.2